ncbi:unnamed protein product [Caenorhabditis bovis]|uniref:Uncharacterized protein n=1 Tax=Caenorhabditis bovis TaxID=2654633 RepID=A0A8S1EQ85_9PELO|nr:unnamed protein product [Caenorhabditis bovis]
MFKTAILISFVALAHSAYDDLPQVSDPYNPPGHAPVTCSEDYKAVIESTRAELGKTETIVKYTTVLGNRIQQKFGRSHEVLIVKTGQIGHRSNYNGSICRHDTDYGFHYVLYPTPGDYNIHDAKLEEYFEKFSAFSSIRHPNIADLPIDPRRL